jgi:hypothetical protein
LCVKMHDVGSTSVRDREKLTIGRKTEVLNLVVLDPRETHNLTLQSGIGNEMKDAVKVGCER